METTMTIAIPSGLCLVNTLEYNKVLEENTKLKNQITELQLKISEHIDNERLLQEIIKANEKTIKELQDENKLLREKIKELEEHIIKQDIKIEEQNSKIEEQNSKIEGQNKTIKKLNDRIDEMCAKSLYDKYMIAIQDLNDKEKLESLLGYNMVKKLKRLRENRNDGCHFFRNGDSEILMNNKRIALFMKLKNMDQIVKSLFDKKYTGLIEKILPHIIKVNTNPDQEIMDEINEWLDD